ncbi:inactive receptor kinase [Populus alba x Populus x berolinensis]|nr:inactive receptor kinase [Populus alba x Populus x berolinensis]KAJ6927720.1 inactive receptor kinase [Populus alba x Populus x berolinensis]
MTMQTICLILLFLVVAALGQSDFKALLELRKGFEKDPSGKVFDSWDSKSLASDGCPQTWYGVICVNGHVVSITLNDVGLVGNFSFPVLAGLKMLRNLSVSNNQLMGTISNVGSIESLEYLDLSSNFFHGLVPSGVSKLKNLVLLNLSSNNFEGIVPSGFGNLDSLEYLDLSHNSFSGDIMGLLSQLDIVVQVDLSSNQFSGSLDLGLGNASFVSSIKYLNASHNLLVGQLFAHDGVPFFDSLEVFDVSDNQITGDIPPFQFVVSLRILRLGGNQLSGSLPEALLQDSSMVLTELDLSLNQLEGPVGSITSTTLRKLNISSNKLSGPLPATVGHCATIDLSNNMLTGNLSRIQNWGNYVEVIQLSSNSLTGTLPNQTSQFLRLTTLKISNNSLNGDLPLVLGTYSELKVIDLSLNFLTGFLLPDFFTSTTLTDLNLGIFAPEISKFHNLAYLNLSNNKLKGSIPGDLPDGLKGFDVSSNNFSGVVPDNLRRFPDSAFHPGNSLLIFPYLPSSSKGPPALVNLKGGRSRMKPAIKIALIASMVGAATIIALLSMVIYYRTHQPTHGTRSLKGDERSEGVPQEEGSSISSSRVNKNPSQSSASLSFHQSNSLTQMGSAYDPGNTSSVPQKSKEHLESITKDGGLTSSHLSSSNASPSKSPLSSDTPGVLRVRSPDKLAGNLHLFDGSLTFTAEELSCAPAEVVGRSCHGALYKATLDSGYVMAIKWLKEGIAKGKKDFAREVKKLGSIRHPNLVSLQGYYWGPKDHEKMIITKYINAQCLAFYLQESEPRKLQSLSLDDRLRIAVNVARCLNFLHNERAIPHGNLKSTNILLEPPNMNPLLTDYSLHRILTSAGTAEQVLNAGALGYRPPEFASSSKPCPSLKSDVYAFGVILLELLTGKCSWEIVSADPGVVDLTDWVRLLSEENRSSECFDKLLTDTPNAEAPRVLDEMLQVALRCILPASERPDMKTVFEDLSTVAS